MDRLWINFEKTSYHITPHKKEYHERYREKRGLKSRTQSTKVPLCDSTKTGKKSTIKM